MTRRVFLGTPCYDGRIDVWYANSLFQTQKLAPEFDVEIIPIWLSYDALLQRARNDCIALALETNSDDIIFIDADIEWQPEWFFQLLSYQVDVVGGTYRKKTDDEEVYVAKIENLKDCPSDPETGLLQVDGLGTGFLRLSQKAMLNLWNSSEPYNEIESNKHRRWIFDVVVEKGNLISEDINLCNKLKKLGFKIYLDPTITCNHIGPKKFKGSFEKWAADLKTTTSSRELYE